MKQLKSWRSIALIVILIGAVFGGWYFTSQSIRVTYPQAWTDWRDKLQDAVTEYRNANNGSLPTIGSGAVIVDDEQQQILDICRLKDLRLMPYPPDNSISLPGADDDNCDNSTSSNCSCHEKAHYLWLVDSGGNVHSACIGEGCENTDKDGYQGIWP